MSSNVWKKIFEILYIKTYQPLAVQSKHWIASLMLITKPIAFLVIDFMPKDSKNQQNLKKKIKSSLKLQKLIVEAIKECAIPWKRVVVH